MAQLNNNEIFNIVEGQDKKDLFQTSEAASSTSVHIQAPTVDSINYNKKIVDTAADIVTRNEDTAIFVEGKPYTSAMCATFVCKVLKEAGYDLPSVDGKQFKNISNAGNLYNALMEDPDYEFIEDKENTKAGDIVFVPGSGVSGLHTGIQSKDYVHAGEDMGFKGGKWQALGGIHLYHDVGKEALPGEGKYMSTQLSNIGRRTFVGAFRRKRDV